MYEADRGTEEIEPVSLPLLIVVFVVLYLVGLGLVFLSPPDTWGLIAAEWTAVMLLLAVLALLFRRDRIVHSSSDGLIRSRLRIYGAVEICGGFALLGAGAFLYGNVFVFALTPVLWFLGSITIWRSFRRR